MGIDTNDVLEAASTKWNFLPFRPGLVGGIALGSIRIIWHKRLRNRLYPEIILAGAAPE
jgi:UDP-N-acetyl-D-galactosamine dehydrogenase